MTDYPDRIVIALGVLIALAIVVGQSVSLVQGKKDIRLRVGEARKLVEEIDGHDFPPPERVAEDYSGRVFKAWEELPLAESLTRHDLYPQARAR